MRKLCGNVLEKTPLARGVVDDWGVDWRRGVVAFGWPDVALGVVGGKCTKEVDDKGNHKDGNPRHSNPQMGVYGTLDVRWD